MKAQTDAIAQSRDADVADQGSLLDRRLLLAGAAATAAGAALAAKAPARVAAQSSPTLREGTWAINGNGHEGDLVIDGIGSDGALSGSAFGDDLVGSWNDEAKEIIFLRIPPSGGWANAQVYTGYIFSNPPNPQAGDNFILTLAGHFEAFAGTGGTAARPRYGWFAQIEIVG